MAPPYVRDPMDVVAVSRSVFLPLGAGDVCA